MTSPTTSSGAPPVTALMTASSAGRFVGKVALITGSARGQGRAEAVRLAAEGADIIALDLCAKPATTQYDGATPADLEDTASQVKALGRKVFARPVDTRDFTGLCAAVRDGVAELGRLDVVVANAGVCSAALSWETSLEMWRETIDINLTGTFHTAKATIPLLIEQGTGGAIVIVSSVAGLRGLPFLAAYSASKHGITGLARVMANELGMHGIRVNTVHPFGVATDMTTPEMQPLLERYASTLTPILAGALPDPVSQPEDIANAVAFLASDEARHLTGVALPVDLGTLGR